MRLLTVTDNGYTPREVKEPAMAQRLASVDRFIGGLRADIQFGGKFALYRSCDDFIRMPRYSFFRDVSDFDSMLAYQLIGWTGAPHRLNRGLADRYGGDGVSLEALVAEFGTAYLCASFGISNHPVPERGLLLNCWLHLLRHDKRTVFTAAALAQAAVDWLRRQQRAAGTQAGSVTSPD